MQSDPMVVLGLILISFEVFNLTLGKRAKKRNEGEGGGEEKDTLDRKPHDSEKNINVQLLIGAEWSC